jgi:hypothetical protein
MDGNNEEINLNQQKKIANDFIRKKRKKNTSNNTSSHISLLLSSEMDKLHSVVNSVYTNDDFIHKPKYKQVNNDNTDEAFFLSKLSSSNVNNDSQIPPTTTTNDIEVNENIYTNDTTTTNNNNNTNTIVSDYSFFLQNLNTSNNNNNITNNETYFQNIPSLNKGTTSIVNIPLANEILLHNKQLSSLNETNNNTTLPTDNNNNNINNNESKNTSQPIQTTSLEEPPTRRGVCIALRILKQRGLLSEEEGLGRYKDKNYTTNDFMLKPQEQSTIPPTWIKQIKDIEYRDDKGRKLKTKEMARYQSHIFHGEKPGIKKTEKQLLREQNKEKMKNSNTYTNSKTMQYMKSQQTSKNKPFAVLGGKTYSSFL